MALFEIEAGRLIPAQFGRPVANGLTQEVLESVRNQVLEIVSRPLFPITWRDMSRVSDPSNDRPRLTALDASGQVVSVEVLEHLDSDTLISSLSRLADTASLSWTDLAREYPGDIEGFKAGWVRFRDSMPPSPGSGPRLVMVVGSIDVQVRPALDVLASSGVEVHEMNLRQMSNGRAFLEVHAVGPRLYGHSPQVLLGSTGHIPELEGLPDDTIGADSTGSVPHGRHEGTHASEPLAEAEKMLVPATWSEAVPAWRGGSPVHFVEGSDVEHPVGHHRTTGLSTTGQADAVESESEVPVLGRDETGLAALGQIVGEDTPLATRPTLATSAQAVFTPQGAIRTDSGDFTDPDAALMACGNSAGLDGWKEWHLGDHLGPSLAESLDEVNREIKREYARTSSPTRQH